MKRKCHRVACVRACVCKKNDFLQLVNTPTLDSCFGLVGHHQQGAECDPPLVCVCVCVCVCPCVRVLGCDFVRFDFWVHVNQTSKVPPSARRKKFTRKPTRSSRSASFLIFEIPPFFFLPSRRFMSLSYWNCIRQLFWANLLRDRGTSAGLIRHKSGKEQKTRQPVIVCLSYHTMEVYLCRLSP